MVNQTFMKSLAMLESVSATQAERDIINNVRGRYVAKFGSDNTFVDTLAQLEAQAATQAERDEINSIRGVFGLMEMTEMTARPEVNVAPEDAGLVDDISANVETENIRNSLPNPTKQPKQPTADEIDFDDWSDITVSKDDMLFDDPEDLTEIF